VTASSGECDPGGTCDEEILIVKAHDPNSSITEIDVWFSENDDAGPIVFAHTYCVQGKAAGEPARSRSEARTRRPGPIPWPRLRTRTSTAWDTRGATGTLGATRG
jgi:hypothetical protein